MARYTVYDLIIDVKGKIHGGSVPNSIQASLDEGRRNMLRNIKPPEMERKAYIEQAFYRNVDKYAVPEDVKYEDVVDIKRLSSYRNLDTLQTPLAQVYRRQFDAKDRENIFAINYEDGVKTMSIYRPKGLHKNEHVVVNEVNSLTENGTWNVGGNVVNLRLDELNHITRAASLSFDINDSDARGWIENHTMKPVDISDYLNTGAAFSWLSLPIPKNMTSVRLTLGSNQTDLTTDFYGATVNQPHDNNEFTTLWNLLKYMLNNLTSTGNPNPKSVGYIRFDFTTTGAAIPNCNLDSLVVRKGHVYEMVYNSRWCIIDAFTRAWKKKTTVNSDQFPFEEDGYQIIMLETALVVQKNIYANNAASKADVADIESQLADAYSKFRREHKAEFIDPEQRTNIMGRQVYGAGYEGWRHDRHSRPDGWHDSGERDAGTTL